MARRMENVEEVGSSRARESVIDSAVPPQRIS